MDCRQWSVGRFRLKRTPRIRVREVMFVLHMISDDLEIEQLCQTRCAFKIRGNQDLKQNMLADHIKEQHGVTIKRDIEKFYIKKIK